MEIPILGGPVCARCGDPLPERGLPHDRGDSASHSDATECQACRLSPPPFERAVAYALYEHRLRAAIHALKYDRMHAAARRLGAMLAKAILKIDPVAPREMLVVPVPLHRSKYTQRGFNQARGLAKYALRALRRSNPDWHLVLAARTLMRLRATETQAGLSPRQRRDNMRGAFQVSHPQAVLGRDILLIDDILTTGATARAASLALKRAGANSVWVATLARAGRVFPGTAAVMEARSGERDPHVDPPATCSSGEFQPEDASSESSASSSGEFIGRGHSYVAG